MVARTFICKLAFPGSSRVNTYWNSTNGAIGQFVEIDALLYIFRRPLESDNQSRQLKPVDHGSCLVRTSCKSAVAEFVFQFQLGPVEAIYFPFGPGGGIELDIYYYVETPSLGEGRHMWEIHQVDCTYLRRYIK